MVHQAYRAIKLTRDGDLALKTKKDGGGIDLALVHDKASVEQSLRIHLMTRLGEDVVSPFIGMPVPEIVGVFNADFIQGSIRRAILNDSRVTNVETEILDFDRAARTATIRVGVRTIEGIHAEETAEV